MRLGAERERMNEAEKRRALVEAVEDANAHERAQADRVHTLELVCAEIS